MTDVSLWHRCDDRLANEASQVWFLGVRPTTYEHWVGSLHTNVKRLQSVQNSAARVVLKDNHHLSSGDLLLKLHWLPVQSRNEFKIACITYKVLTTGQPTYLNTTHLCVLYVQLISTFCSTRGFQLSLPRGRLVTSLLKFGTTYPSISGLALP